jgi:hypothetical protein
LRCFTGKKQAENFVKSPFSNEISTGTNFSNKPFHNKKKYRYGTGNGTYCLWRISLTFYLDPDLHSYQNQHPHPDPDPHSPKWLDMDPHEVNAYRYPKHWLTYMVSQNFI